MFRGALISTGILVAVLAAPSLGSIEKSQAVPQVAPGAMLDLACANVERAAADAISVVLAPEDKQSSTGIRGVLATEQTVSPGKVHVRVPNFPELADHTVRVKVFYSDASGQHRCDGGSIKIG